MLVKFLPDNISLKGVKVKTKKGVVGYFFSSCNHVVFLNDVPGDSTDRGRLYPQVLIKPEDVLQWEVVGPTVKSNCDSLTSLRYIVND